MKNDDLCRLDFLLNLVEEDGMTMITSPGVPGCLILIHHGI